MPAGDDTTTVINLVDAHRLQEITLEKKVFMAYIKGIYQWFLLVNRVSKESQS